MGASGSRALKAESRVKFMAASRADWQEAESGSAESPGRVGALEEAGTGMEEEADAVESSAIAACRERKQDRD